ncbi:hypothetical protein D3C81_1765110 [compost metagenome]
MNGADAALLHHHRLHTVNDFAFILLRNHASRLGTIRHTHGCAIIRRAQQLFALYEDRTNMAAGAAGACGDHAGNIHEISIPILTVGYSHQQSPLSLQ